MNKSPEIADSENSKKVGSVGMVVDAVSLRFLWKQQHLGGGGAETPVVTTRNEA